MAAPRRPKEGPAGGGQFDPSQVWSQWWADAPLWQVWLALGAAIWLVVIPLLRDPVNTIVGILGGLPMIGLAALVYGIVTSAQDDGVRERRRIRAGQFTGQIQARIRKKS